jgi:hypothetical protein
VARGVDRMYTGAALVVVVVGSGAVGGDGGGGGSSGASRSVFTQGEVVPLARATRRSRTSPSAPASAFRVSP